jgi:zinc transporter ZupT
MSAASFWSLLAPAIDIALKTVGQWATLTIAVGFSLGAAFVFAADWFIPASHFIPIDKSESAVVSPTADCVPTVSTVLPLEIDQIQHTKQMDEGFVRDAISIQAFFWVRCP